MITSTNNLSANDITSRNIRDLKRKFNVDDAPIETLSIGQYVLYA